MVISDTQILPALFKALEEKDVDYAVLRGFEQLPEAYSNDIDFGVLKSSLDRFLDAVKVTANRFSYQLRVRDTRLNLLKISLHNSTDNIDIDIWTAFNYAGLFYLDQDHIIKDFMYHKGIKVLKPENEVALSFLKELLHMNRLRRDKVDILKKKLNDSIRKPLAMFFNDNLTDKFIFAIRNEILYLKVLSIKAKIHLILENIKSFGLIATLASIAKFFSIRRNRKKLIDNYQKSISNS